MSFVGAHLFRPGEPVRSFPAAFRLVDGRLVSTAQPEARGDCVGCGFRPVFVDGFGGCRFMDEVVLCDRKYWDCIGQRITACVYRQDSADPDLAARQALETSVRGTVVPFVRRVASIGADVSGGRAGAATTGTGPAKSPQRVPAGSPSRAIRFEQGSLL
ncbi:hypothetical protein [Desulfocurvibacter africanus]|uniref:Uncharacterized protein n=1 Tax=Desulfocurvibacter africanus subsp. africanus str. Walvis Bay TaxID=690850 RepID=F3Z338_DESAF|nr:hypothetical protein [Desulfocurvibacter africanus]EGJ50282.1 hypothetical protein Desaf_1953 [Desulfocurvibacter africanus subsp. africanus str. Walvis Bay]